MKRIVIVASTLCCVGLLAAWTGFAKVASMPVLDPGLPLCEKLDGNPVPVSPGCVSADPPGACECDEQMDPAACTVWVPNVQCEVTEHPIAGQNTIVSKETIVCWKAWVCEAANSNAACSQSNPCRPTVDGQSTDPPADIFSVSLASCEEAVPQ